MSWSYDPTTLATNKTNQVRFLIGDTVATDPQVQNEEIAFSLTQRSSVYGAAADTLRALAARLSREADTVDRDLRTMMSSRAKAYANRARELEIIGKARSGAVPYAGGISIADKIQQELDIDRVPPAFVVNMDENYLPVAPVGNEGTPFPFTSDDESDNI